MTQTLTPTSPDHDTNDEITRGSLSSIAHGGIGVLAIAIGVLATIAGGDFKWGWAVIVAAIAYIGLIYVASRVIEDSRQATDRLATAVMTMAFALAIIPLVSVVWTVVAEGSARFDMTFLTDTLRLTPEQLNSQTDGADVGGAYHAIMGTLVVTGIATAFSVPFGLFTAIYLVEYGGNSKLASSITSMVDVMTGIPSIVAGLFAYALFELILGPGTRTGLAGAIALTVLMTPVVVRSSEEMLRLVPDELREASYALGVQKWKTIVKVVIPTAIAGILTGITLAIARVIGETAPLLVTVGLAQDTNLNPFSGRMTTLPVFTYYQYVQPGIPTEAGVDRSWAASLTLVIIVGILFSAARIMANILKPKGLR